MSIYSDNLNILIKRYPDIAQMVKHCKDDYSVKSIPTKLKDNPTCEIRINDNEWVLESRDNPLEEAHKYIDIVIGNNKKFSCIVICGLGMGYILQALFPKIVNSDTPIYIIEPDIRIFKTFIQNRRLQIKSDDGKVYNIFEFPLLHFFIGIPIEKFYTTAYQTIQLSSRNQFATIKYIEHPVEIRFSKNYFKPLQNEINRIFYDSRASYGNDPEDSWFGVDHMFANMDIILKNRGVMELKDKFKNIPAVIAATGPSLDKNIHLLPDIKNKVLFFAADASLNTFLNCNPPIIPHIVCSLERTITTKKHFSQISDNKKPLMNNIYLAACPVVKPELYQEWYGKHMVIFRDFAHFKWLHLNKGVLNTGKSVTNMAFIIAHFLGCSPIILVGQDLAFAPDGQTHVKGANHARDGLKKSKLIQMITEVPANNGGKIKSLDTWVGMLRRFEYDIDYYKIHCINATEGGALIKGTEIMRLQDAISKYCNTKYDIEKILSEHMTPVSNDELMKDFDTMDEKISDGLNYLKLSYDNLNFAIDSIDEFFGRINSNNYSEIDLENIITYCDRTKDEILQNNMCYYSAMHIIQSWNMGKGNIFKVINFLFNDDEEKIYRLIKFFEFFYGLRILYKMIYNGAKEQYGKSIKKLQGLRSRIDFGKYL